jgi:hypothetical protein
MVQIDPLPDDRSACRVGHTRKTLACCQLRKNLLNESLLHPSGDVINPHLVRKTNVLAKEDVGY